MHVSNISEMLHFSRLYSDSGITTAKSCPICRISQQKTALKRLAISMRLRYTFRGLWWTQANIPIRDNNHEPLNFPLNVATACPLSDCQVTVYIERQRTSAAVLDDHPVCIGIPLINLRRAKLSFRAARDAWFSLGFVSSLERTRGVTSRVKAQFVRVDLRANVTMAGRRPRR